MGGLTGVAAIVLVVAVFIYAKGAAIPGSAFTARPRYIAAIRPSSSGRILVPLLYAIGIFAVLSGLIIWRAWDPETQGWRDDSGYHLGSHITIVSATGAAVVAKASYTYSGNISADGDEILRDVWWIAKKHASSTTLKLSVAFAGQDKYGKNATHHIGEYEVEDLNEVRRYTSPYNYSASENPKWSLAAFLSSSGSPYSRKR